MAKKTNRPPLANNVSRWMREQNLTNADVSAKTEKTADERIGRVDPSAVHRIATGAVYNPRVLTLAAICDVFGKSIDEALGHSVELVDDGIPAPPPRKNRRRPSKP